MRSSSALLSLLVSLPFVFAEPKFTVPAAGASLPAGAITVTWTDAGAAPSISDLSSYQLFLFTGSNASPVQLENLATDGTFTSGNTITATISPGIGGETPKNAYFLGMIATATAGGTLRVYSDRFTLTGMTGVFTPEVQTALEGVTGTAGPPAVNNVAAAAPAAGTTAVEDGVYGTPFNLQTGPTRYAPMQPVPGTKITATNTKPLYSTSSVVLATTYLPLPTISTTVTQAQTFSVASHPNSAPAASQPTDDMQRFLNRWKD